MTINLIFSNRTDFCTCIYVIMGYKKDKEKFNKIMDVKKLLCGSAFVLLLIGITILSWRFYVKFLNLYGVWLLITFCTIDFILDIIAFIIIAKAIINNVEE